MPPKILNVAEKPDAAKKISHILAGGVANVQKISSLSKYNPNHQFAFSLQGQQVTMLVTSVTGHLLNYDFGPQHKNWRGCDPAELFDLETPIVKQVTPHGLDIEKNLRQQAKYADKLILWLDCDREGENISFEVVGICKSENPRLSVERRSILRARFSEFTPSAITRAVNNLVAPNEFDSLAVEARQEIDLRIGAAFTRFQTLRLKDRFVGLEKKDKISYGPCQFPTLGFVVERYQRVKNFIPEDFFSIQVTYTDKKEKTSSATFNWKRGRLYDRLTCLTLYEICVENPTAKVTSVQKRERRKWKPLPLNTVELQKLASRKLRLGAATIMEHAEKLYNMGFISYPRTETNQYTLNDEELQALIQQQTSDTTVGPYANSLLTDGKYERPRRGTSDDKAHPPIHPLKTPENVSLHPHEKNLYELIARHFLASCSKDAKGFETAVTINISGEEFSCTGLMVEEKNYLEIFPYENWADKSIPVFQQNQTFEPSSIMMTHGKTQAPPMLSESDLISLMDKNGIGTDATIAQHIETIQERGYAAKVGQTMQPTELGIALIEAYNEMGFDLSKPNLRAKMEADMKSISERKAQKQSVLESNLKMYKKIFLTVQKRVSVFDEIMRKYFDEVGGSGSAQLVQHNFTKCGKCNNLMNLQKQGDTQFLRCSTCSVSHIVPSKGSLSPNPNTCPICNFQAISIANQEKNTNHTVCPFCFSNPPDIESAGQQSFVNGFRCFQCTETSCTLSKGNTSSGGSRSSAPTVMACPVCRNNDMKLFTSGKMRCSCSGFPNCKAAFWFPASVELVEATDSHCNNCLNAKLVRVKFAAGSSLPAGFQLDAERCLSCDPDMNMLVPLKSPPGAQSSTPRGAPSQHGNQQRNNAGSSNNNRWNGNRQQQNR